MKLSECNLAEDHARELLEGAGYVVRKLETQTSRRADFLATSEGERILVEVTSKTDSGDFRREMEATGEALHDLRIGKSNALDRIFRSKNDQLRNTPEAADSVRLVWIEALGEFADTIARQIKASFYGAVDVPIFNPEGAHLKTCYFFDHAVCFSTRWIDGVVVRIGEGGVLLINPVDDERVALLSDTFLAKRLKSLEAVVSPKDEIAAGFAFSADDFDGDRSDHRAVRAFCEDKYSMTSFMPLRMNVVTAAIKLGDP